MIKREGKEMYRAIVHYHFKKGLEEEGILFLEKELIGKAQRMGCHNLEFWQDEKDASYVIGIGDWHSIEEARNFQTHWNAKEQQLIRFCTNVPQREFYKLRAIFTEKGKRAA